MSSRFGSGDIHWYHSSIISLYFNLTGDYSEVKDLHKMSQSLCLEELTRLRRRGKVQNCGPLILGKLLRSGPYDGYNEMHRHIQYRRASQSGLWFRKALREWIEGSIVPFICHGTGMYLL
jgi:hypothetical protein